jgi:adhesin/invasin
MAVASCCLLPSAAQASGTPTSMTVSLSPTTIPADGVATTIATASEFDDQSVLLPGRIVSFSSSDPHQSIGSVSDNGDGTYSAQITASTTAGPSTITATDTQAQTVAGSAQLTQNAGPPATIAVGLAPSSTTLADGSTVTTATATVTDANNNPLKTETVTFSSSDPGQSIGSVTNNGDGTYSVPIRASTTVNSSITIKATDGSKSGAASMSQIAGPATSPITVALAPSSSTLADGTTITTATATVTDAYGHLLPSETTVSFTSSDPGQSIGPTVTNHKNGTYSVPIRASTTVGASTITATDGSASGSAALTQLAGSPAAITLVLNPPTILADAQSTTSATATVTDAQGHPLPSETVKFASTDKGQFIGGVTPNGDGTYTVQIRGSRTVGSSTITATDGSAAGQATLIQAAGPSTTSLFASTSSPVTNQPVTLVAQVNGGTGAPSGTITFENSGVAIAGCAGQPVSPSSTVATCQTSFGAGGSPLHLAAVFVPGTGSTAPGSTGSLGLDVKPDSTSVAVSTTGSAIAKRRITYIAVVTPRSSRSGPIEPSGTVQFFDNGKPVARCPAQPLVNSTGRCAVVYSRAGRHSITARYGGDADFIGSTSPASTISVVKARPHIRGSLDPTMLWTFHYTQRYTTVSQLIIDGTSAGDTITVTCHGHGCPFTKRVSKPATPTHCGRAGRRRRCAAHRIDITSVLRSHHLRPGVAITVTITRPEWVGKYYVFRIRVGHGPRIGIGCLAPGVAKPGVGCSA